MDHYSNQQNNIEFNQYKRDQNSLESDNESESEFDAFEHHLSQYEHNKELFNNDEDEMMDCGSSIDKEDFLDEHHISLATSFCKNTQEQNEDFLEDKFNGDLLLENFSEDKFIRCKYSEDFCFEQQRQFEFNKQQNYESDEEQRYNHDANEHDKYSEKSSEDDLAARKRHFLDFVCTIPKICTPSVCGTIQPSNQLTDSFRLDLNSPDNDNNLGKLTEANEEALFEDDESELNLSNHFNKYNSFSNFTIKNKVEENGEDNDYEQHKFDWSIDQLATLKPVNISINERKFLRFKDFEQDQLTQEKLSKENELFFSQETIAPSPTKHASTSSFFRQSDHKKQIDFSSIGKQFDRNSLQIKLDDKVDNKDSGNYFNSESDKEKSIRNKELNEFDLSFIEHSASNRLSNIEFDYDLNNKMNTPSRRSSPKINHQIKTVEQWTNLDYNKIHQTSTPCTSLFRPKSNKEANEDYLNERKSEVGTKQASNSLPLQERTDSLKQKKRLFHNLVLDNFSTNNANQTFTCPSLLNNENKSLINESKSVTSSSRTDFTSITVDFNSNDEGICESSREVTFGSTDLNSSATGNDFCSNVSNESQSACNNCSLTPTFKKRRSSSIVKSFAERLNEIDLFNDENNDVNNSTNNMNKYSNDQNKCHNLTDSNCFVIKNFNNLLNNSDSGCYLSNSNSNSGFSLKKRVLFN